MIYNIYAVDFSYGLNEADYHGYCSPNKDENTHLINTRVPDQIYGFWLEYYDENLPKHVSLYNTYADETNKLYTEFSMTAIEVWNETVSQIHNNNYIQLPCFLKPLSCFSLLEGLEICSDVQIRVGQHSRMLQEQLSDKPIVHVITSKTLVQVYDCSYKIILPTEEIIF